MTIQKNFSWPLAAFVGLGAMGLFDWGTAARAADKKDPTKKSTADRPPAGAIKLFDGKSLKNWKVANKNFFDKHGKVQVKNGEIHLAAGAPATGVAYTGKIPRINYEISLEAKRTAGSDFFCGLTFPVNKSYCTLILGGWGGGTAGLSNVNDMSADENETTFYENFKDNTWHKIRLRVTDKKIEMWLGKERKINLDTKDRRFSVWYEQEPMRPLGISTWYTGAALRNIELKRLEK